MFKAAQGSKRKRKRVGRGNASGQGGEAGRGHKGQKSRSGYSRKAGFEGGQMPLYKRVPKRRGFTPINKVNYDVVSLEKINERFKDGDTVNAETLVEKGLLKKALPFKLLGAASIDKKLTIEANTASKTAVESCKKAGVSLELLESRS